MRDREAGRGSAENEDRGMGWSILETLRGSRGERGGGAPRSRKAQFPLGHLMLDWLGHIQIPDTRHPATKPAAWRITAWGDLTAAISPLRQSDLKPNTALAGQIMSSKTRALAAKKVQLTGWRGPGLTPGAQTTYLPDNWNQQGEFGKAWSCGAEEESWTHWAQRMAGKWKCSGSFWQRCPGEARSQNSI